MSDFLANPEESKEFQPRFKLLYTFISIVMCVFALRLWYLQILKGSELRIFSEKNRIKENYMPAPRGMVFDRNGKVLVDNRPGFVATIVPQYASKLSETAQAVGKTLNLNPANIELKVKQSRRKNGQFWPVKIKENLSLDEVARLERLRLDHPGLDIEMAISRTYHLRKSAAHLFGYVGEISENELNRLNKEREGAERFRQGEIVGKSGLEQVYDHELRGKRGLAFVQVDARGKEAATQDSDLLDGMPRLQEAEPGQNIFLNIDLDVQNAAYKSFVEDGERLGALVAMDPNNGEVLAWVSSPSYDPNTFSEGITPKMWSELVNDPFQILRNKVIQTHVAPGSTFKAVVALAALEEKVITPRTTVYCPGFYTFGRRRYHCHLQRGHGYVNIYEALEQSCDVYFYKIGLDLGIDRMAKYAKALGIGEKTQVRLRGEVPGLMPTEEWKKRTIGEVWQPGENLSNAIGQGFVLSTPIQMASVFGAIATEGKIYRPNLVKRLVDTNEHVVQDFQPELIRDLSKENPTEVVISKKNFEIVKEGLRRVSNGERGTAKWYKIPGVQMAGKSGTVQLFSLSADQIYVDCKTRPLRQRHHGWFVGWAPYDDPKIVVSVLAEHACSGSGGGAPVVRDVIKAYLEKYYPDVIKVEKTSKSLQGAIQFIPSGVE